ncbi:MAG TPA: dihydrofolate reductase family protein, partial [Ignavibacteriaceae bacterium]
KLKLQMQTSIDGFVSGPNGELDWLTWNWGDDIKKYVNDLHDTVNTILLGRKMTNGFVSHWLSVVDKHDESSKELRENYEFAKKMIDIPKVVFTRTLEKSEWKNTTLAKGDLTEEVNKLKQKNEKGIIVYGGAGFVSSLIKNNLIDEYHLFINPNVIGKGLEIFKDLTEKRNLKLKNSKAFDCGIVVNQYLAK